MCRVPHVLERETTSSATIQSNEDSGVRVLGHVLVIC